MSKFRGSSPRDGSAPARAIIFVLIGWVLYTQWSSISFTTEPDWTFYGFWIGVLLFVVMGAHLVSDLALLFINVTRTWRATSPGQSVASGGWLDVRSARKSGLGKAKGLFLGILNGLPLFTSDFVHGVVLAPTRKGKTVSFIIPNVARDIGTSRFVTDLRGDLTMQTADLVRAQGHEVIVIDPGCVTGEQIATCNPLQIIVDNLAEAPQDVFADAQSLAIQLHPKPAKGVSDPFWPQGTQKLLTFGCVAVCALRKSKEANLPNLYNLLASDSALELLLIQARASALLAGQLAADAENLYAVWSQTPKIFETFREGALQSLASFGPSGRFAPTMYECSFRFKELKKNKGTLFLVADGSRMEVSSAYIGVMIWAALKEMVRALNNIPVTFLLDEFSNYPFPQVPLALTALAAHGVRLWMVAQEPEELARVYGREALETIMSQSDTKLFFGISSLATSRMVSRMLGQQTVLSESFGLGTNPGDPTTVNLSHTAKPLMSEDELRRMEDDEAILIMGNLRPAKVLKAGFHEIEPMRSTIKPNPFFGEERFKGTVKMRLRGCRAKTTRAGRRKAERSKQPFFRPLIASARFLVPGIGSLPLACVLAVGVGYGVPHLRVDYTYSGSYAHRTIHSCRFVGLPLVGQNYMAIGHDNCPLIQWIKPGEMP